MGLLTSDYYDNLTKSGSPQPAAPVITPPVIPAPVNTPAPNIYSTTTPHTEGSTAPIKSNEDFLANPPAIHLGPDLTPEEQTAKFGGPVGSQAYYDKKAGLSQGQVNQINDGQQNASGSTPAVVTPYDKRGLAPGLFKNLASVLGIKLPDNEEWDKMSGFNKFATVDTAATFAIGKMLRDFPKEIIKAPVRVAATIAQPWVNLAKGKSTSYEQLVKDPTLEVPWLGKIPTYVQSFDEARKAGMGPLAATLSTLGTAAGDVTIGASLAESFAGAFRPRANTFSLGSSFDVKPIQYALDRDGVYKPKIDSSSEYYNIPNTIVKEKYGTSPLNTKLKITPAGDGSVSLSVVELRGGKIPATVDWMKGKLGTPTKISQGDFGPEVQLESKIIPTGQGQKSLTTNSNIVFHGTKASISDIRDLSPIEYGNPQALYGPGVYLTDSEKVAGGYSVTKGIEGTGKVLSGELRGNLNFLDLDKPLQTKDINIFNAHLNSPIGDLTSGDFNVSGMTGAEAIKLFKNNLSEAHIPKYEAADMFFDLQQSLSEELGYDGFKHVGGIGRDLQHNVKILFDYGDSKNTIRSKFQDSNNISSGEIPTPTPFDQPAPEMKKNGPISIPPKALKGFENKPITPDQLNTLEQLGNANGVQPEIRDAVIRTVTGKNSVGELTQAEFVKAAQTLSTFSNGAKFTPSEPGVNLFSQFVSPQRHWTRSLEEAGGAPLYSEAYVPMEEATRLSKISFNNFNQELVDLHGKYAGTGFSQERSLISSYLRGNEDSILKNTALSPEVKNDLIAVATRWRSSMNKMGPALGVPEEIFKSNYLPGIQDTGGITQKYKEGAELPKGYDFFAKFKKKGSLGVQIDDSLALGQIYARQGARSLYLDPVLKRINSLNDTLPANLQGSLKSYVFEKLGYAGRMEQFLDSFVPSLNKKLGTSLPQDTARQLSNTVLSTVYSGLLSSPSTWFRHLFHYPLFGYSRLGPKFSSEAIAKGISSAGIDEVRKAGFLTDLGVPYGSDLTKESTLGGQAMNVYKKGTQAVISPNSMADNSVRSIIYHQSKMIFDDAFSKYTSGKITWDKFEKEADFNSLSPVDRNIIRQHLIDGKVPDAFNHYVRDILDDTAFPYRKAASSRIGYGLGGKLGTSLLQWPIEAASVLNRWGTTGQWDKLIRFYAASSAIQRTMKETFGFDYNKSLFLGPFSNFYSPFVKTGLDFTNMITSFIQQNKSQVNKNSTAILNTLKSAGIPAGVDINHYQKFRNALDGGVNQDGKYSVVNDQHQIQYTTDFAGLFWGELMGFPTIDKTDSSQLTNDMLNAQFDKTQAKQQVMQLIQQEKYKEAADLMGRAQIKVTPKDMDAYYIPFNQRTFQSLPADLKSQFAPRVFPELAK